MFFKKPTTKNSLQKPSSWDGTAKKSIKFFFFFVIVGYILTQIFGFTQVMVKNWDEFKFVYNKPNLVKTIRQDYEKKQSDFDKVFLQKDKSSQDKLLEEVLKQLQEQSK